MIFRRQAGQILLHAICLFQFLPNVKASTELPEDVSLYTPANVSAQTLLDDFKSGNVQRQMRATNYLTGVFNLTEGRLWCSYMKFKPHVVEATVMEKLKALPSDHLNRRAAHVVGEELKKNFPCAR